MAEDHELVARWQGGDSRAGNELFERYFDELYGFLRSKVRDDVDELIQRTFLAAVQNAAKFRGEATFRTWMFAIARNELFAHWRRGRSHERRREPAGDDDLAIASLDTLSPGLDFALVRRDEQRALLHALRRIPIDSLLAIELYYWRGLTGPELARVLDIPEGTARTRIRKARQQLQVALESAELEPGLLDATVSTLDGWLESLRVALFDPPSRRETHSAS